MLLPIIVHQQISTCHYSSWRNRLLFKTAPRQSLQKVIWFELNRIIHVPFVFFAKSYSLIYFIISLNEPWKRNDCQAITVSNSIRCDYGAVTKAWHQKAILLGNDALKSTYICQKKQLLTLSGWQELYRSMTVKMECVSKYLLY